LEFNMRPNNARDFCVSASQEFTSIPWTSRIRSRRFSRTYRCRRRRKRPLD